MRSTVTEPVFAVVSVAPVLPAASAWLAQEKTVTCSVSSPDRVRVDVHDCAEPPELVASPSMVQTSPVTDSLTVMVRVIMSPLFASVASALFDVMPIVRTGNSVSIS